MSNPISPRELSAFNSFAKRWQAVVGSDLLLLSSQGEVLLASNDSAPSLSWQALLRQVSSHEPTLLEYARQPLLIAPLVHGDQLAGYLLALEGVERDLRLLSWGAEMMVSQLYDKEALQDMTDELIGAWNQLELVYRVTQNMALSTDLMAMLSSIVEEIRKVVGTQGGFVLLRHSGSLDRVTTCPGLAVSHLDETLLHNLTQSARVVLCNRAAACLDIWPDAPSTVENLLATHLSVEAEDAIVAIGLINKADHNFNAGDAKLLTALASQVSMVIKVYLVHQRLVREERLRRELEIAAEIQESLLPDQLPQMTGLSVAVASVPASEVGGDFYDFVRINEHRLAIIIGDVAGKGIPAAMLTSMTRTMLRVEAMRGEPPHRIIQQANNVLHQDLSQAESFVTALVAIIDTGEGTLSYASAGHAPVLFWQDDKKMIQQLKATSPPIGIFGYNTEATSTVDIDRGDTLVFYTDGITEAQSASGDFFGLNRLISIVDSKASEEPEVIREAIQSGISQFCQNRSSQDDVTLLVVKLWSQPKATTPKSTSPVLQTIDFSYPADMEHLADISQEITSACRKLPTLTAMAGAADDFIYLIELAISEICTNVVKHAYADKQGNITGCITLLNDGIQLDFYDDGAGFDPTTVPQPQSDPHELVEGGYGLHIVRQIMDVVSYEHHPEHGNHWHLIKLLPSA